MSDTLFRCFLPALPEELGPKRVGGDMPDECLEDFEPEVTKAS